MYVACPSCKSLYQIESIHLRAAGGELHCGACQTRFNATAAVFDEPQQALEYAEQHPLQDSVAREIDELVNKALDEMPGPEYIAGAADGQQSGAAVAATERFAGAAAGVSDAVSIVVDVGDRTDEAPVAADTSLSDLVEELDIVEAHDEQTQELAPVVDLFEESQVHVPMRADMDFYACPTTAVFRAQRSQRSGDIPELSAALLYAEERHHAGLRVPWGAVAASIVLVVVLLAQLAWAERYRLVQAHQLRPLLEVFCQPLNCDLPLRHDISRIEIIEREVRDHPHVSGGLLINAAFVNRAPFAQAYPIFQVSFSDVSGTPLAVRRFPPAEYLIGHPNIADGMAPGERAQLMLEVVDPGDRAVSFQFDFL